MCSGLLKNVINKMCLQILYLENIYKKDLAWNPTQPSQTLLINYTVK